MKRNSGRCNINNGTRFLCMLTSPLRSQFPPSSLSRTMECLPAFKTDVITTAKKWSLAAIPSAYGRLSQDQEVRITQNDGTHLDGRVHCAVIMCENLYIVCSSSSSPNWTLYQPDKIDIASRAMAHDTPQAALLLEDRGSSTFGCSVTVRRSATDSWSSPFQLDAVSHPHVELNNNADLAKRHTRRSGAPDAVGAVSSFLSHVAESVEERWPELQCIPELSRSFSSSAVFLEEIRKATWLYTSTIPAVNQIEDLVVTRESWRWKLIDQFSAHAAYFHTLRRPEIDTVIFWTRESLVRAPFSMTEVG